MKKLWLMSSVALLAGFGVNAQTASKTTISASGGYGMYLRSRFSDGLTPMGRLSVARQSYHFKTIQFGFELGLQSGNHMRVKTSPAVYAALGSVAIQSTIKPLIDVLLTARKEVKSLKHAALFFKVGGAVRTMQFDRDTLRNTTEVTPELQAGLSQAISHNVEAHVFYQVMYSGQSRLTTNAAGTAGGMTHIPLQQGVFFGMSMKA